MSPRRSIPLVIALTMLLAHAPAASAAEPPPTQLDRFNGAMRDIYADLTDNATALYDPERPVGVVLERVYGDPAAGLPWLDQHSGCASSGNLECRVLNGEPLFAGAFAMCDEAPVNDVGKLAWSVAQATDDAAGSATGRNVVCHAYIRDANATAELLDDALRPATQHAPPLPDATPWAGDALNWTYVQQRYDELRGSLS